MKTIIKTTLTMYAECARRATQALVRNWTIVPASAILAYTMLVLIRPLAYLGMAGGFALGMLQVLALTLYLSWISATVSKERVSWQDLASIDWSLFGPIINVSFLLWIAEFFLGSFAQASGNPYVLLFFNLAIVLACNSLAEHIYIARDQGFDAFRNAAAFTRTNAPEWYIPFGVLMLPLLLTSTDLAVLALARANPLLPSAVIISPDFFERLGPAVSLVVGVVLTNWFTVFRGFLFRDLSQGSRRRRAFLAKQR